MPVAMPDLANFSLHKIIYDVDFDDVPVPGLCAAFYRCPDGDRILSVGIYMSDGVELFRAWGYVDEAHCSYHAVSCADGSLDGPHIGCPDVEVLTEDETVVGIAVSTRDREYFIPLPRGVLR
ncbi:hypothetical protein FB566_4687 [Stackebrandtia endophytica]|uniref:Uncharacterized protein n=2 Tax=Stackebrandtia endophytica TaxID=1496996 RepID=A0A543B2Q5_9ACTN|nr:hypothetical protein [Stackebrandtia endophytica]TQL79086.1 hypothetical protein FB566_4687 [Stackebrandtia endophytica]